MILMFSGPLEFHPTLRGTSHSPSWAHSLLCLSPDPPHTSRTTPDVDTAAHTFKHFHHLEVGGVPTVSRQTQLRKWTLGHSGGEFWGPRYKTAVENGRGCQGVPGGPTPPLALSIPCTRGRGQTEQVPLHGGTQGPRHLPGCLLSSQQNWTVGRIQEAVASPGTVRLTASCQGHRQRSEVGPGAQSEGTQRGSLGSGVLPG